MAPPLPLSDCLCWALYHPKVHNNNKDGTMIRQLNEGILWPAKRVTKEASYGRVIHTISFLGRPVDAYVNADESEMKDYIKGIESFARRRNRPAFAQQFISLCASSCGDGDGDGDDNRGKAITAAAFVLFQDFYKALDEAAAIYCTDDDMDDTSQDDSDIAWASKAQQDWDEGRGGKGYWSGKVVYVSSTASMSSLSSQNADEDEGAVVPVADVAFAAPYYLQQQEQEQKEYHHNNEHHNNDDDIAIGLNNDEEIDAVVFFWFNMDTNNDEVDDDHSDNDNSMGFVVNNNIKVDNNNNCIGSVVKKKSDIAVSNNSNNKRQRLDNNTNNSILNNYCKSSPNQLFEKNHSKNSHTEVEASFASPMTGDCNENGARQKADNEMTNKRKQLSTLSATNPSASSMILPTNGGEKPTQMTSTTMNDHDKTIVGDVDGYEETNDDESIDDYYYEYDDNDNEREQNLVERNHVDDNLEEDERYVLVRGNNDAVDIINSLEYDRAGVVEVRLLEPPLDPPRAIVHVVKNLEQPRLQPPPPPQRDRKAKFIEQQNLEEAGACSSQVYCIPNALEHAVVCIDKKDGGGFNLPTHQMRTRHGNTKESHTVATRSLLRKILRQQTCRGSSGKGYAVQGTWIKTIMDVGFKENHIKRNIEGGGSKAVLLGLTKHPILIVCKLTNTNTKKVDTHAFALVQQDNGCNRLYDGDIFYQLTNVEMEFFKDWNKKKNDMGDRQKKKGNKKATAIFEKCHNTEHDSYTSDVTGAFEIMRS